MSKQQDSTTQHPRELLSHHPDPEQTGRVYLSPRTPGGEGGDPVGQSWCLQVRRRPLRSLGGWTGPASSQGSGLGPDSAEFLSLASRVFLGWGNLPAVTYARVLLVNFLLLHGLPGRARPAALLLCGGGSAPFPQGQLPHLNNQVLPPWLLAKQGSQ